MIILPDALRGGEACSRIEYHQAVIWCHNWFYASIKVTFDAFFLIYNYFHHTVFTVCFRLTCSAKTSHFNRGQQRNRPCLRSKHFIYFFKHVTDFQLFMMLLYLNKSKCRRNAFFYSIMQKPSQIQTFSLMSTK